MNASFKKRLCAYLIDIVLVVIIVTIISLFIPISDNAITLNQEMVNLQDSYLKGDINFTQYFNGSAEIVKDLDQEQIIFYVLMAIVIIAYFVIWPFYHSGQTFGKKKLKIRVVKNNDKDATINDLLIRNVIINSLGYLLIQLLIVFVLPSESYYITLTTLSFIQLIIVLFSAFMIIKRKDKCGIHDLIAKTKVIEVKK